MQREELGTRIVLLGRLETLDGELAETVGGDERVVRDDPHSEAAGAPRDLLSDPAEAEHAERLAGELDAAVRLALPATLLQGGVRLRDVARKRDEEPDRVLRRRDDGRLRCIRNHDPPPRRGLDVDVVDTDAGAPDHLQTRSAVDELRRQLGRRTDHDRVVAVDDRREVALRVDVDLEMRSEELDARGCDGFPDQNPWNHQATRECSYASRAAVTATPRSTSAPRSASTTSTAASIVTMSNTSNQPMWPRRKILPSRSPCPFAIVIPKRLRRPLTMSVESIPSGARTAVTTALRSSSGEKSSRPIAFAPARAARPSRMCRSKTASRPSSSNSPSATSSAATSDTGGVKAASSFACALRVRS